MVAGGKSETSLPDSALVRKFQSGSDPGGAIEGLFDRYGQTTYAFFCRTLGDSRIAQDLNQDLYLEVIKGLPGFRRRSSFKTWLFRLAYCRVLNLRRRWRTHLDEHPADVPGELWNELAEDARSPEAALDADETRFRVRRCLARLPEIERAVVLDRYYGDLPLQRIAEDLALDNPSGARAFMISALRKLRRCLERLGIKKSGSSRVAARAVR